MFAFLKRPYYTNTSGWSRLRQAVLFGLFVFLFLFVFEPFQIGNAGRQLLLLSLGFALVTFLSMVILNIVLPRFFPSFYAETRWTLGKEILQTTLNLFFIGVFNFLFFSVTIAGHFMPGVFLWFQFSTVAVGVFPLAAYFILNEKQLRKRYEISAADLSVDLAAKGRTEEGRLAELQGQQDKELLRFRSDQLLFIRSADNYIDVFLSGDSRQRRTIRATLKSAQEQLAHYPFIQRCHRGYIVNLNQVVRVGGNAQGYKLFLANSDETIPVARQYNDLIKNHMAARP